MDFEGYVDERTLVSRDAFGTKEIKIKVVELEDEYYPLTWKFGEKAKVKKIFITIKHVDTKQVEEGEFDLSVIEKEMKETRHYSSTNRWLLRTDIKNGYVVNSKHVSLLNDAIALDYIVI